MRSLVPLVVIATALVSCQGFLARAAWIGSDERVWQDDAYCKSIGTQFGTLPYHECRLALSQQREARHSVALRMGKPYCAAGRRRVLRILLH